jgi:hypothetical protein
MTFSVGLRVVCAVVCALWLASCTGSDEGDAADACFVVRGDEAAAAVGAGDTFASCQQRSSLVDGAGWRIIVEGGDRQSGSARRSASLILSYPTAEVGPTVLTQATPSGTTGVQVQVGYGRSSDGPTYWNWGCGHSVTGLPARGTFEVSVTSVEPDGPKVHGTVHAVCSSNLAGIDGDLADGRVTIDGTF